ncbi:Lrp/AsnC family transcriptional regulator [Pseudonocardia sp. GCM10023141]|uniref:Lrp/AsnC family transcriptional regulator n=1 Tax=Pseudonocardia sp. GCM10023141 TaxID=3252653 RepID=UPI00361917A2
MRNADRLDATDARLLLALSESPRASVLALSERLGLSRNTVQARLAGLEARGVLASFERRIDPAALGFPLTAYVMVQVVQRLLDEVAAALGGVPEVLEVQGVSGPSDLLVKVVARDGDDLYRIAGLLLAIEGVERTSTSMVMTTLVEHRVAPLLQQRAAPAPPPGG